MQWNPPPPFAMPITLSIKEKHLRCLLKQNTSRGSAKGHAGKEGANVESCSLTIGVGQNAEYMDRRNVEADLKI